MDPPPLDNQTDFIVHPQLLLDRDGEVMVAMVKSTWELEQGSDVLELAPSERQRGIRPVAIPWGLPEETTPMFPGDFCVRKPGTDVVVVARGYAPNAQPVPDFEVSVRGGALSKVLRVFGLRVWQTDGQGMSAPRPISELDLRYEYAWGGAEFNDEGEGVEEPRNPMGRGKVIDNSTLRHQPAPQIEDPFNLILNVESAPPPAGFAPIARYWRPRRDYVGTHDDKWLDERAPLPPKDQDDRVALVGSPGLIANPPLVGNEEVALAGLMPGGGSLSFRLPKVGVEISVECKDREPVRLVPHLDTVVIDQLYGTKPGWPTVELMWRGAIPAPRRMKDLKLVITEKELP